MADSPSRALLALAAPDVARALAPSAALDEAVSALVRAGREAWPRVALDESALLEHVARHLTEGDDASTIRALHAADLHLAAACATGHAGAIAEVERILDGDARPAVGRVQSGSGATLDEVMQAVREKLFVGDADSAPKIAQYAGRGPLGGWLRVVAVRTALSLRRRAPSAAHDDEQLIELAAPDDDPEVFHARAEYAVEFREAFHLALRSLSAEDRNVLRLHLIDGLTIDELGSLFNVHRATAARWIGRCRDRIAEETRRRLAEKLRLEGPDLDSLVQTMLSKIDVSIQRVLGESAPQSTSVPDVGPPAAGPQSTSVPDVGPQSSATD